MKCRSIGNMFQPVTVAILQCPLHLDFPWFVTCTGAVSPCIPSIDATTLSLHCKTHNYTLKSDLFMTVKRNSSFWGSLCTFPNFFAPVSIFAVSSFSVKDFAVIYSDMSAGKRLRSFFAGCLNVCCMLVDCVGTWDNGTWHKGKFYPHHDILANGRERISKKQVEGTVSCLKMELWIYSVKSRMAIA